MNQPSLLDMIYLAAMFLSLMMVVVSVHRYNERQTSSILAVLVSIPFTMSTVIIRSITLAIIISFYPLNWSLVLFSVMIVSLLVINAVCEAAADKHDDDDDEKVDDDGEERTCCAVLSRMICSLPAKITRASVSIISPLGYNNDR